MRPSQPTFPRHLFAAIILTGAAGVAVGARLQDADARTQGFDPHVAVRSSAGPSLAFISNAGAQTSSPHTYRFVDDHPKLAPLQPPDVAAPKFSRIVIEKTGVSRLEGDGTPGSQVLIKAEGIMIGAAIVDGGGHWGIALSQKLKAGDHAITSVAAGRETTQPGDEVRIFIPHDFQGREIVAYDRARQIQTATPAQSTLQRAQELAMAASKRFTEIVPVPGEGPGPQDSTGTIPEKPTARPPRAGIDIATPVENWFSQASRAYRDEVAAKLEVPAAGSEPVGKQSVELAQNTPAPTAQPQSVAPEAIDPLSAGVAAVRDWMNKANDTYNREIATPLSVPVPGEGSAEASKAVTPAVTPEKVPEKAANWPVVKSPRPAADTSGTSAEAARKVQMEIIKKQAALREAEARAEAQAKASADTQRQVQEAKRHQAEDAAAKVRDAERTNADKLRKEAEARKMVEGMKRLEAAQQADQARKAKAAAAEAAKPAREQKPAALAELPSQREAAGGREQAGEDADKTAKAEAKSEAKTEADNAIPEQPSKPLEFSVDQPEDDADLPRSRRDATEEGRSKRLRQAQLDERRAASPSAKRSEARSSEANSKATRVQSYRSRREGARRARSCAARTTRPKGSSHMIYVVQPGDTLWAIANRHYRSGSRYNIIYRANQERLPNADLLRPCQKLVLPKRGRK